jgi:hypothetical protein
MGFPLMGQTSAAKVAEAKARVASVRRAFIRRRVEGGLKVARMGVDIQRGEVEKSSSACFERLFRLFLPAGSSRR